MAPALAAQYPIIKTYAGTGLDDPMATLRADLTPRGFHAQVLSSQPGGTFYIDPLDAANPAQGMVSYWRQDLLRPAGSMARSGCQVVAPAGSTRQPVAAQPSETSRRGQTVVGQTLRTYRLALAATGEYTAFAGGTVADALAAITTSVNRVTGVYEKELGVRLELVANNTQLIYTDGATDPYLNVDGTRMLAQNQINTDNVIGTANYDIGHVFSTGGGGVAALASVNSPTQKAHGVTGSPSPVGDAFDIDYVAHEMGHQFGGLHPFNGNMAACGGGSRTAGTAWEPGSGSTIMGYAGICAAQDLQPNSDAYFHGGNLAEMIAFINTTSAVLDSTGNMPPVVSTPANKLIPANTPFRLTATATDLNGDALTYSWEEFDRGAAGAPLTPASTQVPAATPPLFRSWSPVASPTRYFPRLSELRLNTVAFGEALPSVARLLRFRCTVRDQHVSAGLGRIVGGVNQSDTVALTVVDTGAPFVVTSPDSAIVVHGGAGLPVTWNVAGTTANGINSLLVDILLSTDGGLTFPIILASGLPNSGFAVVTLPTSLTSAARIMVASADNYFFNISKTDFEIAPMAIGPAITGFYPTSGTSGTVVTLTGANFTGATSVLINGVSMPFTVISATSISFTVPVGATSGPITVVTAQGTGVSVGIFQLRVTGRADELAAATFFLWPNPARGTVNVQHAGGRVTLQLLDLTGREVRRTDTDATGAASLSTAALPAGVYVVRVGSQVRRLVVE